LRSNTWIEKATSNTGTWSAGAINPNASPKITSALMRPSLSPYHAREDKLVMIREYRVPVGGYMYGFPAGLLDPGEDLAGAARRELHEETGLDIVTVYRHSPAIYSSAGITDEAITMVFAEVTGTPSIRHTQDSEDIEIFLMDRQQVRQLLQCSDIAFGARAWMAMDAYARMGKAYLTGDVESPPPCRCG